MRWFRKIGNFLGFVKDEAEELREEEERDCVSFNSNAATQHLPQKGISVAVQVPADRPPLGPLLIPCSSGDGGVQVRKLPFFLFSLQNFVISFVVFVFLFDEANSLQFNLRKHNPIKNFELLLLLF